MIIRNAKPEDAARLLEIYAYYVKNTAVSFEITVPFVEEFQNRIENISKKFPYLVLEKEGVIQGYAYASLFKTREAYRHCCELSIYIDRNARRKGFGRKLYGALEERLKQQGVLNLYACIASPITGDEYLTEDSERFHRCLGFVKTGEFHRCAHKFGHWYNMIYMEKFIGQHS